MGDRQDDTSKQSKHRISVGIMEDKLKLKLWPDEPPGSSRRLRLLAEAASEFFDQPLDKMKSRERTNEIVWPRVVCMWVARDAGYTLQAIGDWWVRDHGTVSHAVNLVNNLRETKPAYDKQFRQFLIYSKTFIQKHSKP